MSQMISLKKSRPSNLKRLKFLPRLGITVDFLGRELNYKYAPILETLFNTWKREACFKELMEVSFEQLKEISFHNLEDLVEQSQKTIKKAKSSSKK